jgi:hypothetical protein
MAWCRSGQAQPQQHTARGPATAGLACCQHNATSTFSPRLAHSLPPAPPPCSEAPAEEQATEAAPAEEPVADEGAEATEAVEKEPEEKVGSSTDRHVAGRVRHVAGASLCCAGRRQRGPWRCMHGAGRWDCCCSSSSSSSTSVVAA